MKNVLEALEQHFANTTKEQRQEVWDEIESLNLEGPNALEFIEYIGYEYPIPYLKLTSNYNISLKMTPNFMESFFLYNIAT